MFFSRISSAITRGLATNASRQGFLKSTTQSVGRRFMSRSNADISMTETVMWLVFGGVPFTVFGIYQTAQIKARVEAYDAGEIVPIKTLSNDEWLEFKEKVKERMALLEDEDEDDDDEDEEETAEPEEATSEEEPVSEVADDSNPLQRQSGKDTIIFVEK